MLIFGTGGFHAVNKIYKNTRRKVYSLRRLVYFILSFVFPSFTFAATPKLVNKLNDAFNNITDWLIKLATPAAAVAVGIGVFMKKFSFGDEERIRTAKKLIRGSLFSYAFILAIQLILSAIKSLVG